MSEEIGLFEEFVTQNQKPRPIFTLSAFGDEIATDLDEQLDIMLQYGVKYLDLRGVWGKNVLDLTNDELKKIDIALRARQMGVSCVASPIGKISINAPFEPELARLERALEIADWVGSSYIRIFSFYMPPEEGSAAFSKYRTEVMRRLTKFAEASQPWGMILLHENEKGIYGDTAERCLDIIKEIGSGNLRVLFDPANFVQVGDKPFTTAYPLLDPHLTYLHIKDAYADTGKETVAGAGDGEVEQLLRALWERGYQGYLGLEPHLSDSGQFSGYSGPQKFAEAVNALKQLLARIGAEV